MNDSDTEFKKHLEVPEVATSGSDGSQTEEVKTGQILPPITETTVPERPFAKALSDITNERSRGLASANAATLAQAAYQQLENEYKETKSELLVTREKLTESNDALSRKDADLRVANERIGSLKKIQWVSGFLYVVATVLIGIAVSSPDDGTTTNDIVLLALGVLSIVAGLFSPTFFSGKD